MAVHSADAWKLALALVLGSAILFSLFARAPRFSLARPQLHRLVLSALTLYAVGALAWLTHHRALAAVVCAGGTGIAALAAWFSRGASPEDPPSPPEEPADPEPPAVPDGGPEFDWAAFEEGFRAYSARRRTPEREPAQRV
jgi:hypothetical protein